MSETEEHRLLRELDPEHNKGSNRARATTIEYKGKTYYGWRELQENTGVSKHLYKKYYINGMDPEERIGKNGPVPGS